MKKIVVISTLLGVLLILTGLAVYYWINFDKYVNLQVESQVPQKTLKIKNRLELFKALEQLGAYRGVTMFPVSEFQTEATSSNAIDNIRVVLTDQPQPLLRVYSDNQVLISSYGQVFNQNTHTLFVYVYLNRNLISSNNDLSMSLESVLLESIFESMNYSNYQQYQRQVEMGRFMNKHYVRQKGKPLFIAVENKKRVLSVVGTAYAASCTGDYVCGNNYLKCGGDQYDNSCTGEGTTCQLKSGGYSTCQVVCIGNDNPKSCSYKTQDQCDSQLGLCAYSGSCMASYGCAWGTGGGGGGGGGGSCSPIICGSQTCDCNTEKCCTCGCKSSSVSCAVACAPASNNPKGFHDSSNCTNSSGWTCDADNYATSLQVNFYADGPASSGTFLGSTLANIPAEAGVASACGGYANHRFSFVTPDSLKDGFSHYIYAYGVNVEGGSNTLLNNSPLSFSCTPLVPNCKNLTGPASMYVGDTGTYQATYEGPVSMAAVAVTSASCANYASFQRINAGPGSYPFSWTPSEPGTYEVDCRAWNDGIAECRGNCVDGPPRYPCVGPVAKMTVNVLALTKAWWQVKDSDLLANGDIKSEVPGANYFDLVGNGGYPGVPVYSGTTNLTSTNVSTSKWLAKTSNMATKVYGSNYFINLIPTGAANTISSTSIPGSYFTNNGIAYNGYYWFVYDGATNGNIPLTISSAANLGGRKVVLIVKNANLNINGNINLDDGTGFFLAVTSGNINVAASVGSWSEYGLEGIYVSDGTFSTGTTGTAGDIKIMVRGSVASYGGINLQRDLGNLNNAANPAEFFEYAPDLELLFPVELSSHVTNWREIAP